MGIKNKKSQVPVFWDHLSLQCDPTSLISQGAWGNNHLLNHITSASSALVLLSWEFSYSYIFISLQSEMGFVFLKNSFARKSISTTEEFESINRLLIAGDLEQFV